MTLHEVLIRLADRHAVAIDDEDTPRGRQVASWLREWRGLSGNDCEHVWGTLSSLVAWPKYAEVRDAVHKARNRLATVGSTSGCPVCRNTGWVGLGRFAWACLCPKGQFLSSSRPRGTQMTSDPVRAEPVSRDLYDARLANAREDNCENESSLPGKSREA